MHTNFIVCIQLRAMHWQCEYFGSRCLVVVSESSPVLAFAAMRCGALLRHLAPTLRSGSPACDLYRKKAGDWGSMHTLFPEPHQWS